MTIRLKGDARFTLIIPSASIYTGVVPAEPTWPFHRWGVPISTPREAACLNGESIRLTCHGFARARIVGGQEIETGEDHAGRLAAAYKAVLHRAKLTTDSGEAIIRLINCQTQRDGTAADDWHVIAEFDARMMA